MHTLFWKIFVSFWLTLIIFTAALMFAASRYLEYIRTQQDMGGVRARMSDYLEQAQATAQRKGKLGLREWLEHLDRNEAVPIFLIDEAGIVCSNGKYHPISPQDWSEGASMLDAPNGSGTGI